MPAVLRRVLFLLLLAGGARADQLVAGPEVLLGDSPAGAWAAGGYGLVLAGDGDETLVLLPGTGGGWNDVPLFAMRLDREGRPLGSVLQLVPENGPIRIWWPNVRAAFLDGVYVVFYFDGLALRALRVSREGTLLDDRLIDEVFGWSTFELAVGDREVALFGARRVVRLRRDLTPIAVTELGSVPESAAAGIFGYALAYAVPPAVSVRLFDGKTVRELIRLGGNGNGSVEVVWTGTEYVVAWTDCSFKTCSLTLTRFDAAMQRLGEPVTVAKDGAFRTLTVLGDNVVALTWSEPGGAVLQRFRAGVAVDPKPIRLSSTPAAAATNGHGLLILADSLGSVSASPAFGAVPAPFSQLFRSAANEQIVAAGGSATEIGLIVRQSRPGESTAIERLYRHDGQMIRERVLTTNPSDYAFASDGTQLAVLSADMYSRSSFRNLSTGQGTAFGGSTDLTLAWANGAYHTWAGSRVIRISPEGVIQPVCVAKTPHMAGAAAVLAGGGGELLRVTAYTSLQVLRFANGCPGGAVLSTPLPFEVRDRPAVSWNGEQWGALLSDFAGRLHFATAPAGGAFTLVRRDVVQGKVHSISLAPAAGGWMALAVVDTTVQVVLIDSFGTVSAPLTLADTVDMFTASKPVALVPLAGGAMAYYTRNIHEPPYFGVHRVFARAIAVEPVEPKRRAARH
jgi:hypothetical protein